MKLANEQLIENLKIINDDLLNAYLICGNVKVCDKIKRSYDRLNNILKLLSIETE